MNQTAIITGASTGIGLALAHHWARDGLDLGLIARRQDLLEKLQRELKKEYPDCRVFIAALDVNNTSTLRENVQKLSHDLGRLDLFVANAGIGYSTPAWQANWPEVEAILKTNILGAVASLEAAKEIMLKQGHGQLVGVSSVAAFKGLPASSAYCASKAALTVYMESLRVDLAHRNITVTSIHPGYIATPMTEKNKTMPFLLTAEEAARRIAKAIRHKKSRFIFPMPMKAATWIMRLIPNPLYDYLISLQMKKGVFKE